jgi:LPS-assembly lipoprotein
LSSSRKTRVAITSLAALALAGCGFTPLYGDNGNNVQNQLAEVSVGIIPDRPGQLLRQSLQEQFQAAGAQTQEAYVLNVSYTISIEGIGVQPDTSTTRNRYIATALWSLAPIGNPQKPLTQGQASTEDALNIIDQQYFALTLENNTVNQQLADEIAGQISTQVAAYFKTHPGAG